MQEGVMGWPTGTHKGDEKCIRSFVGKSEEKMLSERPRRCGRIILKRNLQKWSMKRWTVFIWLRIGTNGELLRTR
jgi:hypothetical protein